MPVARRQFTVAVSLLGGIALGVVWLLTPSPPPPPPAPPVAPVSQPRLPAIPLPTGSDPESVALRLALRNGERIYQGLCYHCHGRQGKGDRNAYMASIGHQPADHTDLHAMQQLSDEEFFRILRDGVKDKRGWLTMPPWASVLTPAEMWDVIRYVRRLPLASPAPPP
jgi:mono/diheme cytochrome c family protein